MRSRSLHQLGLNNLMQLKDHQSISNYPTGASGLLAFLLARQQLNSLNSVKVSSRCVQEITSFFPGIFPVLQTGSCCLAEQSGGLSANIHCVNLRIALCIECNQAFKSTFGLICAAALLILLSQHSLPSFWVFDPSF